MLQPMHLLLVPVASSKHMHHLSQSLDADVGVVAEAKLQQSMFMGRVRLQA